MRALLCRLVAGLTLVLAAGWTPWATGPARAATTAWVGDTHAAVRLITRDDRVGEGSAIEAGLEFRFAPGWHGYWRTPGDAGLPPMIDWSGSDNVARGDVVWPAPTRLVVQGLQNGTYAGTVILPATLLLKAPGRATTVRASVGYAACSNICVPFQADLDLFLAQGASVPSAEAPLLAAAQAKVPGAPDAAGIEVLRVSLNRLAASSSLVVDLRSRGQLFDHPDLFVEGAGAGLPGPPRVELEEGGRTARLTVGLGNDIPTDPALTLTVTDGSRAATVAAPRMVASTAQAGSAAPWFIALMSALVGGLILNLMPCVLPVLSIKLMGLVRHAGAGRRAMRLSLLATATGVIASFLGLGAVLIGLRWSGASLGWGIQFQQPWFLAGMASLTVVFAASLFDWVAIGLPSGVMTALGGRSHAPMVEAFLTGAFATLLATPCSAPFVGTAVGFALAQGPAEILGIFLCLGLGMALPYGAAALFPGLVRWIPRPGPWMIALRIVLGFLLLGTAGWLLAVLWSEAGGLAAGIVLCILAGLLTLRGLTRPEPHGGRHWVQIATAVLVLAPLVVVALPVARPLGTEATANWQAFDPAALPGLVARGKTVFVDVTATWCLTCKVNELTALGRPDVAARLNRDDVIRMRADWSRPDPSIAAYLHGVARFGIPLDVVYGPMRPRGEPLPELLTPQLVISALDRASAGSRPLAATIP